MHESSSADYCLYSVLRARCGRNLLRRLSPEFDIVGKPGQWSRGWQCSMDRAMPSWFRWLRTVSGEEN